MAVISGKVFTSLDIVLGSITFLLLFGLIVRKTAVPRGLHLPPGPRGKPIAGNAGDMPTHHEWETYTRWAKEYGELVYIKVFGQSMIFVNSADVARDLFDSRSSWYSDRFTFPMWSGLMGMDYNFGLMGYGEKWRKYRKMFHQSFHPAASTAYHQIQTRHTRYLLRKLNESSEDFITHIRHHAGAIIMEIIYGIKVRPTGDPYIELAEKAMSAIAEAGNPATFLVDLVPSLKYVPEWMPGAGFRKKARVWRESIVGMAEIPFAAVKKSMSVGDALPSYTTSLLERLSNRTIEDVEEHEKVIRSTGAVAYAAGSDTTFSAMTTFILTMVLYPETKIRAQIELDSVLGDRLPEFEDRQNLPYIDALCKEVLRWHPVVPLAVAHRLSQDDEYRGYFMPGDSVVTGNSWAILHDEKTYGPNPEEFIPERFFQPGVKDPDPAFGYGRRICPGRYMAMNSMFIAVASILKVFDITHANDAEGNEIPVEPLYTSGLISHPEPFKCAIKPRSASAENLLSQGTDE